MPQSFSRNWTVGLADAALLRDRGHLLLRVFGGQPAELARFDQRAVRVGGLGQAVSRLRASVRRHDDANRQVELARELEVALVVRRARP